MIDFEGILTQVEAAQEEVTSREALAQLAHAATALGLAKFAEETQSNPAQAGVSTRMRAAYQTDEPVLLTSRNLGDN